MNASHHTQRHSRSSADLAEKRRHRAHSLVDVILLLDEPELGEDRF